MLRAKQEPVPLRPLLEGVADSDDTVWLGALYSRYSDHIRDVVLRHGGPEIDAEDLVHDVFLIARGKVGLLRAYDDPGGWLHLTALREVWRTRRRARLRRYLTLGLAAQAPPDQNPQEATFIQGEVAKLVYSVLDQLPLRQREALVLFHLEGLTSVDIGRLLGCPEETVRSRIFHGKRAFVKAMERERLRSASPTGEPR